MKKITIFTLVMLFCVACSSSDKIESTTICGEVINADSSSPKILTVFPYDFAGDGDRLATDISQSEHSFSQKIMMTHKHDVAINYNGEFYTFIAEPCDSIFVTIDAKSKDVTYSGSKAMLNRQMHEVDNAMDSIVREIYKFDLDTDVDGVVAQVNDKMNLFKESLDAYCAANCIDDEVKSYQLSNTLYVLSNHMVIYDRQNDYSPERYRLLTHEVFDIYNPDRSISWMYSVHLMALISDFMESDPDLKAECMKKDKDITKLSKLLLEHTLRLSKSVMRDIMLSKSVDYLKYLAEYKSVSVDTFYNEQFLDASNYSNPKFMELYVRPILQPQHQEDVKSIKVDLDIESEVRYLNQENEVENLGDIKIIDHVKAKYRGKVIYIDIWATWCGPCIEEMKHAKTLHKRYGERDDLTFVNLCFASKSKNWVQSIEQNAIGGENYFIEGDDAAMSIFSSLNLAGYPSYVLIDKDGEIVTTAAFRPSQLEKLSKQLDKLL